MLMHADAPDQAFRQFCQARISARRQGFWESLLLRRVRLPAFSPALRAPWRVFPGPPAPQPRAWPVHQRLSFSRPLQPPFSWLPPLQPYFSLLLPLFSWPLPRPFALPPPPPWPWLPPQPWP